VRIFICYAVHVYLLRRTCVFVTPYMFICYAVHVYLLRRTCLFVTPYMFICYAVYVYLLRRTCLFVTPYMFICYAVHVYLLRRTCVFVTPYMFICYAVHVYFHVKEVHSYYIFLNKLFSVILILPWRGILLVVHRRRNMSSPFWLGLVRSAWWISCTKALLCRTLENRHLNRAINKLVLAMIY
jgi:hypothetical protein